MLSAYAISILSAQGAWRESWSEDALREQLTTLGTHAAHGDVELALYGERGRMRKGTALIVVDGDPELELGTMARIAQGDDALVDSRLVVGRLGEARLDINAEGHVFADGTKVADSLITLIETHLRALELGRQKYLFHTPPTHVESFVAALSLEPIEEASDSVVRYWSGGPVRARAVNDTFTMGVRHTADARAVVEHAAEHALPLRYESPEAVLMVRPPSKAPRTHRKGIEAPAWCRPREHGVVRYYRRGRHQSISQWLYVDEQVTEILGPGIDMITRERFIGVTDELDDVLSPACVAWLRARGATIDPADASTEEDRATLNDQEREWDTRFAGLSVDAERPLRVGVTLCGGAMARFGSKDIAKPRDLPRAIERWLLHGKLD